MKFTQFIKTARVFLIIWLGQLVSTLGSSMTSFATGIWLYQKTGSVTPFALTAICVTLPRILFSPLAGAMVDRFERRKVMIISDSGAALSSLVLAALFFSGRLEPWHVYLCAAWSAAFGAFQAPAYKALIPSMIDKEQLGRANGFLQLAAAVTEIFAPMLAGALLGLIALPGILIIDFASFWVAVAGLWLSYRVVTPTVQPSHPVSQEIRLTGGWFSGWKSIQKRTGLVKLLAFSTGSTFFWSLFGIIVIPMILGFSSPVELGRLLTIAGIGMLLGGVLMSAWGGPRRKIMGVLLFELISGVGYILIGFKPIFWLVAASALFTHFTIAIMRGSEQSIWQSQVAPQEQGRFFAFQQVLNESVRLAALVLAGPLADQIFTPWLQPGGWLVGSLGAAVGVGAGRGIGLLIVLIGLVKTLYSLGGLMSKDLRRLT